MTDAGFFPKADYICSMNPMFFRLLRDNEIKVHELNYLFWECTTRCNLHCRHCGSDCTVQSREKDMPLEDFLSALDTLPKENVPKDFLVVLTGGEPLLRPDIETVGVEIRKRGMNWGMVSNGWFYAAIPVGCAYLFYDFLLIFIFGKHPFAREKAPEPVSGSF